ncbi:MAG TPA: GNAT family N-acetyltransferase [Caulobacteraceae bacterium]|nr:GNAT family N-acetyltransferase [Caulobacteraceae bacterium]
MELTIRPLTPDLWPALEDLFGRKGACNGCWCMFWRIGSAYRQRPRDENREAFREIVGRGPPPGLVAFDGELAVGWCQVTPRADLPWMDRGRVLRRVDDTPVWSISCFYVRSKYRGQGVTAALIEAAIEVAREAGAPAIEAIPIDRSAPGATRNDFTGVASTFRRLGFEEVARRSPPRPILRLALAAR